MRHTIAGRLGAALSAGALVLGAGLVPAACSAGPDPGPGADRGPASSGPLRIVTAGDSITAGGPPWALQATSYPEVVQRACGDLCDVDNQAHAGACLLLSGCYYPTRLRKSLTDDVWSVQPPTGSPGGADVAVVLIGTNDLGGYNETETFVRQLRGIRRDGRRAGVRVVFGTITPARSFWPQRCEDQRQELNAWIRAQPGSIDFAAALESPDGELRRRFDSGDGLHPNARAYRLMGRVAWTSLRAAR